jgi:biotin carboxyl carrier protein
MRLTLALDGERLELRLLRRGRHLSVTLPDGSEVAGEVTEHDDGTFTLEHAGGRALLAGLARGADRQLWLAGRTWSYQRAEALAEREGPGEGAMTSTIPAVVREVLVAEGEAVAEGQRLLLLESMKTILPIVADRSGQVGAIFCGVGDAVAPGAPLIRIDEAAE